MLDQAFNSAGFQYIPPGFYMNEQIAPTVEDVKKQYDTELVRDGDSLRKRAYMKLYWERASGDIRLADSQLYFQTHASNHLDGGKPRQFKVMNKTIIDVPVIQQILSKNMALVEQYEPLKTEETLTIGLHFIRYLVDERKASCSSPPWLHRDDEPLVFIHLIYLADTAIGGDNLIASGKDMQVSHVIRLEKELETLVLNRNVYHAVTPLGSRKNIATRDILLFTVEPAH